LQLWPLSHHRNKENVDWKEEAAKKRELDEEYVATPDIQVPKECWIAVETC
jgi:predicted unusual protein kinase regulating ubiquinone biosynthesis (AarF/ABC1/UbiB family)